MSLPQVEKSEKKEKDKKKKKKKKHKDPVKKHDDDCYRCREGGELVMCDRSWCPKAYHLECLNLTKPPHGQYIDIGYTQISLGCRKLILCFPLVGHAKT